MTKHGGLTDRELMWIGGGIVALLVIKNLPSIASKLGSQAVQAVQQGMTAVVSPLADTIQSGVQTITPPTYVSGVSYPDLVAKFGQPCADAIVSGGLLDLTLQCPWNVKDELAAMQGAKTMQGFAEVQTLRRGPDGVYR